MFVGLAALVLQRRPGPTCPFADPRRIAHFSAPHFPLFYYSPQPSQPKIADVVPSVVAFGSRIASTNGSFDPLPLCNSLAPSALILQRTCAPNDWSASG